jgi:hypothetical protein
MLLTVPSTGGFEKTKLFSGFKNPSSLCPEAWTKNAIQEFRLWKAANQHGTLSANVFSSQLSAPGPKKLNSWTYSQHFLSLHYTLRCCYITANFATGLHHKTVFA